MPCVSLYFVKGQPLYYLLIFGLWKAHPLSYDALYYVMNELSCLASAVSIGCVYLACRTWAHQQAALLAAFAVAASPTVLELSTYAHPVTLSIE